MELYPLPGSLQPSQVDRGWMRSIRNGRRTVAEVLQGARAEMELEDEVRAYRADPLAYIHAYRRRHTLWGRLFSRR
jgi:hypothetical protein